MRRVLTVLGAAALAAGSFVVATGPTASAGFTAEVFTDPGANGTSTNEYVVPEDVCRVTIEAIGAEGGDGASTNGAGGLGGSAEATIDVTPGETLAVYVGGKGGDNSAASGGAGGVNGGGDGGDSPGTVGGGPDAAGGGGGASDVRQGGTTPADRVVVAGGGGGGGGASSNDTRGGTGGGTTGGDGYAAAGQANPGLGGTQSAGGAGGIGQSADSGENGSEGLGGAGADGTAGGTGAAGGGGGGGYYGGGGAGAKDYYSGAGGGGGSGFTPTGTGMSNGVSAENEGDGEVTITPSEPGLGCPSVLTVRKVVSGTAPDGFVVNVQCARQETVTVDADLPFDKDGLPDEASAPTDWWASGDVWVYASTEIQGLTCTATETASAGATTVSYTCDWAEGLIDQAENVGCPGEASGPSAEPASVTFAGNGDLGLLTVTNTFVVELQPTFTG